MRFLAAPVQAGVQPRTRPGPITHLDAARPLAAHGVLWSGVDLWSRKPTPAICNSAALESDPSMTIDKSKSGFSSANELADKASIKISGKQPQGKRPSSGTSGKKGGGPKTQEGKAKSSMNAVTSGLHVSGWIDDQEQSEYEALFESLCQEHGTQSQTLMVQYERMASTIVKLRRLQRSESAQWQKARSMARQLEQQRPQSPSASEKSTPSTHLHQQELALAELTAMPSPERLTLLQRYQTSLDRQLSKIIGEIQVLTSSTRAMAHEKTTLPHGSVTETIRYADNSTSKISYIDDAEKRS